MTGLTHCSKLFVRLGKYQVFLKSLLYGTTRKWFHLQVSPDTCMCYVDGYIGGYIGGYIDGYIGGYIESVSYNERCTEH